MLVREQCQIIEAYVRLEELAEKYDDCFYEKMNDYRMGSIPGIGGTDDEYEPKAPMVNQVIYNLENKYGIRIYMFAHYGKAPNYRTVFYFVGSDFKQWAQEREELLQVMPKAIIYDWKKKTHRFDWFIFDDKVRKAGEEKK